MGKVYWDKDEIAIPAEAYVNTYDGRVYVKQGDGRGGFRRVVIGRAASKTTMSPNENFRALFPAAWEAAYGTDDLIRLEVKVGTYALALGAGLKSGAYAVAQSAYGLDTGNALMDYAMFAMRRRSSATHLIEDDLADQVTFCPTVRSDSWYSDTFRALTEEQHLAFRVSWLERCRELGVTRVWISIDGSNSDCSAHKSELSEPGKNKSHDRSKNMFSYIEAVSAADGRPVTYFVNPGGVVDCKAFQEIFAFLMMYGMEVDGVILDRGFCTHDVIRTLRELHVEFVVALPHDTVGYKEAFAAHAEGIRWDMEDVVDADCTFGVTHEGRIWGAHKDTAFINLYFDGVSAALQCAKLIRKICAAMDKAQRALALGRQPAIEKGVRKFLALGRDESGRVTSVEYDYEACNEALKAKGFFALASSSDMGARTAYDTYQLRDPSEKEFMILKSQEGLSAARTHFTSSIRSKLAVGFLASLLRYEIRTSCKALRLDTNQMLGKVGRIHLLRSGTGVYTPVRDYTNDELALLSALGVEGEDFVGIACDFNQRILNPIHSQKHRLPEKTPPHRQGRGRVKGSKNRKTLEREAEEERQRALGTYVEPVKRKPGRPKGSKDTKPRKRRSDAGVKRGPRKKAAEVGVS